MATATRTRDRAIRTPPCGSLGSNLILEESAHARTQEFVLRWRASGAARDAEIVRQQFTFAPAGTTREREEYSVDLDQVVALELLIVPDISGGEARATFEKLSVA